MNGIGSVQDLGAYIDLVLRNEVPTYTELMYM